MHRRHLLQFGVASAALISLPRAGWGQQSWGIYPFGLGVASGSPTSDSIVLWTRLDPTALEAAGLSDKSVDVVWEIAHDERFTDLKARGTLQATPALAHSVHAEVEGLEPGRGYFYRFIASSAVSTTGRTQTFPAVDAPVNRLRLAYASCQQWGNGYYSAYRHMLDERLDFVLFLGDYIYEYPVSRPTEVRPTTGGWINTLAGYRSRYALHKSDLNLQAAHAAYPWVVTWDDHEVQNDYAGTQQGNSGKPVADFMARRHAAYQAFYEHMPVRRASFAQLIESRGENARVFSSMTYGRLAALYTLDDRQFRDPQAFTPGDRLGGGRVDPADCASWNQPQRTLLGQEQEGWIRRQFEKSTAQWNILGQQTLFGSRNFDVNGGQRYWNDGWDGYPAARQRLIDAMMQTQLSNPVLLGGDVHENWVGHVLADYANPHSAKIGVEFCGTSITSLPDLTPERAARILAVNPHFIFANTASRGYGVAEFTPKQLTVTLRAMTDAANPDSSAFDLAKFSVPTGHSTIEQL